MAEEENGRPVVLARLVWIEGGTGRNLQVVLPLDALQEEEMRVKPGESDPGGPPVGRYLLMRQELGAVVDPYEPVPVFLHESHQAGEESWAQPLPDVADETRVADEVWAHVYEAVELAIGRGAVPIGPTLTRSLNSPWGPVVHGICVLAWPQSCPPTVGS